MAQPANQVVAPDIDGPARLTAMDADLGRRLLDRSSVAALELPKPPAHKAPYRDFVRALLTRPGFKLDCNRQEPDEAFAMLSNQLLGPGVLVREREMLVREVAELKALAAALGGGPRVMVSVRTYFAPGDLVWHVDRTAQPNALRILWPLGRRAGMKLTPADNIDRRVYDAFMQRELPLLCELDRNAQKTGKGLETLWAHRPAQVKAMMSGAYPFLRNPEKVWEITPDAASIHRFDTPFHQGSFHRSSWENLRAPGLQIVMTAGS